MGHIANKIDAKDKKLSEVLNGQRYRIDSFQREYRWQRKHIEALISDLTISFLTNFIESHTIEDYDSYDCYYMGPIVLCQDKSELSIVDGQQRLTSFTLLLIYLYHAQSKLGIGKENLRDLIPFFYVTKAGRRSLVLNVETRKRIIEHLLEKPETVFEDLIELELTDPDNTSRPIDVSVQNIIERYEDITVLFPKDLLDKVKLPLFIEWLLEKVILVEVKAYNMENAYTIFETMNDRGMTLSPTEILKGFLLSKIIDEEKSDEANEFWKLRVSEIVTTTKLDGDLDFFRAWLRAKYAVTIRTKQSGSENEDFELIGTQFNSWVKNNSAKTLLKKPDDYYFFIQSDFNFYSNLNKWDSVFESLYISNFYPLADSLFYPLTMSPISKIDDDTSIENKLLMVANFIDTFIVTRTILNKSITQSTIRYPMYELTKDIRNRELEPLKSRLLSELGKSTSDFEILPPVQEMNNWGFYHYFFARLIYHLNIHDSDFYELLRSKKQSSFVLLKIFEENERPEDCEESVWTTLILSVSNYCLVRRYDLETIEGKRNSISRIKYLIKQDYLPESKSYDLQSNDLVDFLNYRDISIRALATDIWNSF
jgi:uncharacterized protein with ParB-like and HNH nuclease domain